MGLQTYEVNCQNAWAKTHNLKTHVPKCIVSKCTVKTRGNLAIVVSHLWTDELSDNVMHTNVRSLAIASFMRNDKFAKGSW